MPVVCRDFAAALLALAAGTAAVARDAPEPLHLSMSWQAAIDADGHVTQLTALPNAIADRVPQVRAQVESAVRGWRFVPGSVDGRPAPTQTVVSVRVALVEQAENSFRIAFDDARTGGRMVKIVPPPYPRSAVMANKTGRVLVRVDYDADGNVVASRLDKDSPKIDDRLAAAALGTANVWKFEPERVDGHGVGGTQVVPVCFNLSPVGANVPPPACEWNPPGTTHTIGAGESLAVDPVARLATDVAGHAL